MKNKNKNKMGYFIDLYLKTSYIKNKKSTYTTYQYVINKHIYPYFKDYSKDSINLSIIIQFINYLSSNGLNNKSIRDILLILHGILRLMDVKIDIPMPKLEYHNIKTLSQENQILLEKYLLSHLSPTNLGIYLSLYTGIRIGELCALNIHDIDFYHNKITISHTISRVVSNDNQKKTILILNSPKTTHSIREIPLPIFMIPYFKRINYQEDSYILTNTKKFMDSRNLLNHYKKVLKILSMDDYTFHALRHTFATRCIHEGCDPKTLSEILGHASIKITLERYVHPSYEDKQVFMNQLKPFA